MLFIVLLLGAAGGETAASIFTKLDYDKSYFESVVRLKERGQSDSRFSPSEWEKEVGRATANLPVLQTLYAERAAYEQGQPFSLPKTTAGFRVYSNLVCMLNLLQAQAKGSDDDVIRYGSRVVIDARENLGKVVGEKPEYYLSLYRQLFFAMAAAYYHLGKDDDALKWFARIRGDADIQKLQKELGAHAQEKRDPKAERLEAMRQKPIVVMPFETSDADKWRGRGLMELVTADLVQKTPLLVVERAQLDKVLKEMELAQAGATREKSAAKIGELLAAGTVLTGSIAGSTLTVSLVGTGDGVTLAQRTANVGTDNFFGPARGVVLDLLVDLGWIDALSAAEIAAEKPPKDDTLKGLLEARVKLAGRSEEARALYAKAVREDPAYARLFGDLQKEFSDVSATLAVMPFVNASGAAEDLWMIRGIESALTSDLPGLGFTVVERSRLAELLAGDAAGQVLDVANARKIGDKVAADFLVMGGLIHADRTLRVDLRFVEVRTGVIAFATSAEDRGGDLTVVLGSLATQIGERFKGKLDDRTLAGLVGKKMGKGDFEKFARQELAKDALQTKSRPKLELGVREPARWPFWLALAGAAVGAGLATGGFIAADIAADQAAYQHAYAELATVETERAAFAQRRNAAAGDARAWTAVGAVGVAIAGVGIAYAVYDELARAAHKKAKQRLEITPSAGVSAQGAFVGLQGGF
ncbi:MAG: hypothetical protein IT381_20250 [Deltaproteobacteria bacterium]|nr:hypothetical protein [Deltaproteobacteria bacterium]